MRFVAVILVALVAASLAMHEFCGTSSCPPNPATISCNDEICFSNSANSDDFTTTNSIYFTTDSRFTKWDHLPLTTPLKQVREIYTFTNGAVAAGGFNRGRASGLFYSPDGKQILEPVGVYSIINSLRRVRPPSAKEEAYVIGLGADDTFERVGAIALVPEGQVVVWDFPPNFTDDYGYPGALHSVKEGIWLVTTSRIHPQLPGNVFRSTDYGKTWKSLIRSSAPINFVDVTCCPDGILCAAVGTTADASVVYVSTDGGMSWFLRHVVPPSKNTTINSIRIAHKADPIDPIDTIVYTSCSGDVKSKCTGVAYYSSDAGKTWSVAKASKGTDLRGMEIGPDGDSVIIAGRNADQFGTFTILQFNETRV